MPPKRPAPLSDAVFNPPGQKVVVGAPTVLGVTNNGQPLPVKNTFIDVPSGLTPSHMVMEGKAAPCMTAPPELQKPMGFVQRAIVAQTVTTATPTAVSGATPVAASSAVPPSPGIAGARRITVMPLATPSPTGAPLHFQQQWSYASRAPMATLPGATTTVAAMPAAAAAAAPTTTYTMVSPTSPPPTLQLAPRTVVVQAKTLEQVDDEDEESDENSEEEVDAKNRYPENAPKPPPGAKHPSLGSEAHEVGGCKRCCFFPRGRCMNGYNCEFCHYEHEKRKRKNKKKKKKKDGAAAAAVTTTIVQPSTALPMQTFTTLQPTTVQPTAVEAAPPQYMTYQVAGGQPSQVVVQGYPAPPVQVLPQQPWEPAPGQVIYGPVVGQQPVPQPDGSVPQMVAAAATAPSVATVAAPVPAAQPMMQTTQVVMQPMQQPVQMQQYMQPMPTQTAVVPMQQFQAMPMQGMPQQVFAAPPMQPPIMQAPPMQAPAVQQVTDPAMPPPPVQSPKGVQQVVYQAAPLPVGPVVPPPPMTSPKLPKSMMPAALPATEAAVADGSPSQLQ